MRSTHTLHCCILRFSDVASDAGGSRKGPRLRKGSAPLAVPPSAPGEDGREGEEGELHLSRQPTVTAPAPSCSRDHFIVSLGSTTPKGRVLTIQQEVKEGRLEKRCVWGALLQRAFLESPKYIVPSA